MPYRVLFEGANFGVCIIDIETGPVYQNNLCSIVCHKKPNECSLEKHSNCPLKEIIKNIGAGVCLEKNYCVDDKFFDVVTIVDKTRRYIFFYPVTTIVESLSRYFEKHNLTNRELEVLSLLLAGKSNDEIGNNLKISLNTVKTHLKNIYKKIPDGLQAKIKDIR